MKGIESMDNGEELERVVSAINNFCDLKEISTTQLRAEYLLAKHMYTTARPENPPPLEEMDLQSLLSAGIEAGLDDDYFSSILDVRSSYEVAVQSFNTLVDGLKMSEDEKQLLKSIIEKATPGKLVVRQGDKTLFMIELFGDGQRQEEQAMELIDLFSRYEGDEDLKIEFASQ